MAATESQAADFAKLIPLIPWPVWWALLIGLFLYLVRAGVLNFKRDRLELSGTDIVQGGMDHLKARVIELEASETKLKGHKAKLVAFSTRCLVHFGGCGGGCPRVDKSREKLQSEYDTLMEEVNS